MKIVTDLYKKTEWVLYNYNKLKKEIKNLIIEIEEVTYSYKECASVGYSERTGETNKISRPVEEEVTEKDRLLNNLNKELRSKQSLIKKVDNFILDDDLDNVKKDILEHRYLCDSSKRLTWQSIGYRLSIDSSNCCKIRKELINEIAEVIWVSEKYQEYTKFVPRTYQDYTQNDQRFTQNDQTFTKNIV
ncbi:MAG: siderophore-interacting protein [Clostridium sp.]